MAKITTELTITAEELIELVQDRFNYNGLEIETIDIEKTGDYDRGNYNETLKSITFTKVFQG